MIALDALRTMIRWGVVMSTLGLSVGSGQAGDEGITTPSVRVMSFNIRYGTARDGENHWDKRRDFLVETITSFQPDLLGTQETLGFQRDYLAERLPDYDVLGVGRNDGQNDGEMTALYFRKDRFRKTEGGHFWLSETPEVAGSRSWDSALPRMVTWVRLTDLQQSGTGSILFLNTHFDHQGQMARLESARLLRRQIDSLAKGSRVIFTGDFNASENSPPYQALFASEQGGESPVVDSYRRFVPNAAGEEGTFSGFRSSQRSGPRIDWIAVSREWKTVEAGIDRTSRDGRTPSDHFPVFAVLALPNS